MKKQILMALLLLPLFVVAQQSSSGFSLGYTTNGYGGIGEYNHYFGKASVINFSVYASQATFNGGGFKINYNNIMGNVGYYHRVHNVDRGKFRVLLGGGGTIGAELSKIKESPFDNGTFNTTDTKLIYGGYIGSNMNYIISEYFALSLVLNQFYHANSDIGKFAFYSGLGIKFFVF